MAQYQSQSYPVACHPSSPFAKKPPPPSSSNNNNNNNNNDNQKRHPGSESFDPIMEQLCVEQVKEFFPSVEDDRVRRLLRRGFSMKEVLRFLVTQDQDVYRELVDANVQRILQIFPKANVDRCRRLLCQEKKTWQDVVSLLADEEEE